MFSSLSSRLVLPYKQHSNRSIILSVAIAPKHIYVHNIIITMLHYISIQLKDIMYKHQEPT